jgi:hypothetical protein
MTKADFLLVTTEQYFHSQIRRTVNRIKVLSITETEEFVSTTGENLKKKGIASYKGTVTE